MLLSDWVSLHQHNHTAPVFDASLKGKTVSIAQGKSTFHFQDALGGLNKRTIRGMVGPDGWGQDDVKEAEVVDVDATVQGAVKLRLQLTAAARLRRLSSAGQRPSVGSMPTLVLPNPPRLRDEAEDAAFKRGLAVIPLLYAHAATTCFLLTDSALDANGQVKPSRGGGGGRDYFWSGWTVFEMTISRVNKDQRATVNTWPGAIQIGPLTASRWRPFGPPLHPNEFHDQVFGDDLGARLHFTNRKDDSHFVVDKVCDAPSWRAVCRARRERPRETRHASRRGEATRNCPPLGRRAVLSGASRALRAHSTMRSSASPWRARSRLNSRRRR